MTGRTFKLANFKLDKNGKPVRTQKGLSVSKRIAQKKSKRVRVARLHRCEVEELMKNTPE